MLNNTHANPLQECNHSEVGHSFRSTYAELFENIDMRKQNISFKIKNHLPAIHQAKLYPTDAQQWYYH